MHFKYYIQPVLALLATTALLAACETISAPFSDSGDHASAKSTASTSTEESTANANENRFEVLAGSDVLQISPEAADSPVEIPASKKNSSWLNRAVASRYGNIALRGFEEIASTSIGNGESFNQGLAPRPVIATDQIIAMDGSGTISAHNINDIDEMLWLNEDAVEEDEPEILGGGLSIDGNRVYATTGFGKLLAIDRATGQTIWQVAVGAPVRGAPDSAAGIVVVLTADNQTIAYSAETGEPVWNHRGIQESSGFFSMTSPVIAEGLVMVAYSSGELFALRLETGRPVWADSVSSNKPTSALSGFSGVNADPMVQDGVVYTVGSAGGMIANANLNGRPLWQQDVASLVTPWGAGNVVYVLSTRHELAGLLKRDGAVAFKRELGETDHGRDITPKLYAPIMLAGALCVMNEEGRMRCYDPSLENTMLDEEFAGDIAADPIAAKGYLFLITKNGRLYQYGK